MLSAICFDLDQSKSLSSVNRFTLSLLMTTQEALVDSVYKDQAAQNVHTMCTLISDPHCPHFQSFLHLAMEVKNYD